MRILITGNTGYIGATLAQQLRRSYPDAHITGLDVAEEGIAGELVVTLPLEAEAARVDEQVAAVGGVLGQPGMLGQTDLLEQRSEVFDLVLCAAVVVQEGEVADVFRRAERDRRAGMDLVVERVAQRVLCEQGHGGRRAARQRRESGNEVSMGDQRTIWVSSPAL